MTKDAIEETLAKYNRGLIMVFTGDGKGKTTAALGQALRALGHGSGRIASLFLGKAVVVGANLYIEVWSPPRWRDVTARDNSRPFVNSASDNTPLHLAAERGFQAVAEVLVIGKAGLDARNDKHLLSPDCQQAKGVRAGRVSPSGLRRQRRRFGSTRSVRSAAPTTPL